MANPTQRFAERPATATSLYESDFFEWTQEQARRLRRLKPPGLDWENAAEEIDSVGRSKKTEIRGRMGVLLMHLLKWQFQPDRRTPGWQRTMIEQRRRLRQLIDDSPSLRPFPASVLDDEYEGARLMAANETGLPLAVFPTRCPFTITQVSDPAFWPEPSHG